MKHVKNDHLDTVMHAQLNTFALVNLNDTITTLFELIFQALQKNKRT